jgi:hypothetical protein
MCSYMKTLQFLIIVIMIIITSVTFGSYVILNPIVSDHSNSQNATVPTPPPSGPGCHEWTQGEWITVPCSTPSLPH